MRITARSVSGSSPINCAWNLRPVHQGHIDLRRAVYDVTVSENEPVRRKDEPGTAAGSFVRPLAATAASVRTTCYLNINDRGTNPLRGLDNRT